MRFDLLSPASANNKMAKNDTDNYIGAILHLAPHKTAGLGNVCPSASEGCKQACLYSAGRGAFSNVQAARIRKTKLYFQDRERFDKLLEKDLCLLLRTAKRKGLKAYCRLNGTSDLSFFDVIALFSEIQFYDYTKRIAHVRKLRKHQALGGFENYHLTFSNSESNSYETREALSLGVNVAVVFDELPQHYFGVSVHSGDESDLRFLDPKGCGIGHVIGLKAKGKAKHDKSGFVKYTRELTRQRAGIDLGSNCDAWA